MFMQMFNDIEWWKIRTNRSAYKARSVLRLGREENGTGPATTSQRHIEFYRTENDGQTPHERTSCIPMF